jgi:hypothetical protein
MLFYYHGCSLVTDGHIDCAQVNYNLMSVNAFMATTGLYQLSRKLRQDYGEQLGLAPENQTGKS